MFETLVSYYSNPISVFDEVIGTDARYTHPIVCFIEKKYPLKPQIGKSLMHTKSKGTYSELPDLGFNGNLDENLEGVEETYKICLPDLTVIDRCNISITCFCVHGCLELRKFGSLWSSSVQLFFFLNWQGSSLEHTFLFNDINEVDLFSTFMHTIGEFQKAQRRVKLFNCPI